jgi:hypothetical protein
MEPGTSDEEREGTRSQGRENVLKHPLREKMFAELLKRRVTPAELAETLGRPEAHIAYHYRVLEGMDGGIPTADGEGGG